MDLDRATVCLPTQDRAAAHAFYTALGFGAVGELGDDGLPEPLQFDISGGLRVMLIPSGGFGWVVADRPVARRNTHECLFVIGLPTATEVDELVGRAKDAGAEVVVEPGPQTWGDEPDDEAEVSAYAGTFADPDGHLWQVSRDDGVLAQ